MTARAVYTSLNTGKMKAQGIMLTDDQKKTVAEWVTRAKLKEQSFPKESFTAFSVDGNTTGSSGWGGNVAGSGFQTLTNAGIGPGNVGSLHLKWAFAVPDATVMRSRPAEVGDWIIMGDQFGAVYAIQKSAGKLGWVFTANAAVRGAISVVKKDNRIIAYFADFGTDVFAVDVSTGKQIWSTRAGFDPQSSITGSVAVYGGKVYVPISSVEVAMALDGNYPCCVSSGGAVALDAESGQVIWQHRMLPKAQVTGKKRNGKDLYGPSGAPVWCSPTVDAKRGLLLIGTGENYSSPSTNTSDAIQALDLQTGKLVWNFQGTAKDIYNLACPLLNNCPGKSGPDLDFGMAPLILKNSHGKDMLVAGQKSGEVYALEPASGKLIWTTRIGKGGKLGGVHWGMTTDGTRIYVANADNILGIDQSDSSVKPSPGIYALNPDDGRILWKALAPVCNGVPQCIVANSAAPSSVPGVVFAGALDGHIRAYSSADGKVLWDFNTAQAFPSVQGIPGHGGAIDGPSPLVSGGMMFVNSGYGMYGEMSGNVLLAFEVDKKVKP
jgi:polyvinyl alcohol dehydrogenase (cytochrome)